MKSLLIILLVAGLSWYNMDIEAASRFRSTLLPAVFFFDMIALALWLVFNAGGDKQIENPGDRFDL